MESINPQTTVNTADHLPEEGDLPPGDHALEVGARAGIGPLSPLGKTAWHGEARPCVSCGQLVRRGTTECDHCEQDLREEMVEKMRMHAGPWYVFEHVRPFPGVSLERIILQVRRGLITETSIVRGPATDHHWRFAVETPGLCRYFGRCWNCHEQALPSDSVCKHCLSHLFFEQPKSVPVVPPAPTAAVSKTSAPPQCLDSTDMYGDSRSRSSTELVRLSQAVHQAEIPMQEAVWDEPPRIAGIRATWIVLAALVIVIGALVMLTQSRSVQVRPTNKTTPTTVQPRP